MAEEQHDDLLISSTGLSETGESSGGCTYAYGP